MRRCHEQQDPQANPIRTPTHTHDIDGSSQHRGSRAGGVESSRSALSSRTFPGAYGMYLCVLALLVWSRTMMSQRSACSKWAADSLPCSLQFGRRYAIIMFWRATAWSSRSQTSWEKDTRWIWKTTNWWLLWKSTKWVTKAVEKTLHKLTICSTYAASAWSTMTLRGWSATTSRSCTSRVPRSSSSRKMSSNMRLRSQQLHSTWSVIPDHTPRFAWQCSQAMCFYRPSLGLRRKPRKSQRTLCSVAITPHAGSYT